MTPILAMFLLAADPNPRPSPSTAPKYGLKVELAEGTWKSPSARVGKDRIFRSHLIAAVRPGPSRRLSPCDAGGSRPRRSTITGTPESTANASRDGRPGGNAPPTKPGRQDGRRRAAGDPPRVPPRVRRRLARAISVRRIANRQLYTFHAERRRRDLRPGPPAPSSTPCSPRPISRSPNTGADPRRPEFAVVQREFKFALGLPRRLVPTVLAPSEVCPSLYANGPATGSGSDKRPRARPSPPAARPSPRWQRTFHGPAPRGRAKLRSPLICQVVSRARPDALETVVTHEGAGPFSMNDPGAPLSAESGSTTR